VGTWTFPFGGGVNGVGPLALLWCQGSLGVSSIDRCPGSNVSLSCLFVLAIQCPGGLSPLLIGGSLLGSPRSTGARPLSAGMIENWA
jgi:hypothetical protein